MANLSNIILPDATSVILKDNSQNKSDHRHYSSDVVPIVHKLYEDTSYYATAANQGASTWYVASVKPDSWYLPWKIRFKFHTYCPNYPAYESVTYSMITGRSTGVSYANWNEIQTTAHYYINVQPLTAAGFNAGYGFAIGVSIYAATDYTKAAYYRSFEVDFLECENCTVNVLDTPVKWTDWPGTGTTNYGTLVSTNAAIRGLQETGDNNDVIHSRIVYFSGKTGTKGIWAGSLFMEDGDGTFQNIATASDGTVTTSNRTMATTKKANTNGFKIGSSIWYPNTTYNANTNISGSSVVYSAYGLVDTRYVFNTTLTANCLTPYKLIYLVGEINPVDNLFYLDQDVWWTQTPDDITKVYVLVGGVFDSTTSNCRMQLYEQNKWYRYDGANLVEFIYGATTLVSKGSMLPIGNTAPYLFRQSGGDNNAYVGTEETDKLVGASAVVNQLVKPRNASSGSTSNLTFTHDGNGSISITGTADANASISITDTYPSYVSGHKYYIKGCPSGGSNSTYSLRYMSSGHGENGNGVISDGSLITASYPKIFIANGQSTGFTFKPQIVDLTAMFGTAIADYVYSLEQATAGSGIAYLRKYGFFTKDYYPYTANTLQSVNTSAHITTGVNRWDEEWEQGTFDSSTGEKKPYSNYWRSKNRIAVLPNTTYYAATSNDNIYRFYYDISGNYIGSANGVSNQTFTTPNGAYYLNIVDVTRNSYDSSSTPVSINYPSTVTTYNPYIKHEYALPNIDLRGLYKLDANNNLYADGDTLEGDGTLTRKRERIVLNGSENWQAYFSEGINQIYILRSNAITSASEVKTICDRFVSISINDRKNNYNTCYTGNGSICFNVQDYTVTTWKEFLASNPVTVEYELATPTTEASTGFTNPQIVSKDGTEEYVDNRDMPLPVGHETDYLSELYGDREKLDSLPNRANANGTYAISQTLGQMTLVPASEISVGDAKTVDGYTISTTSIGSASAGTAFTLPKTFSTTDIPNISKKTVVTSASGATAAYANGILTFINGSFETGDSVTVGTPIAAYTGISATETVPNISVETKTVATATRDES